MKLGFDSTPYIFGDSLIIRLAAFGSIIVNIEYRNEYPWYVIVDTRSDTKTEYRREEFTDLIEAIRRSYVPSIMNWSWSRLGRMQEELMNPENCKQVEDTGNHSFTYSTKSNDQYRCISCSMMEPL